MKHETSYEKYLHVTYEDLKASLTEFLEIDNSVSVHCKNLQCLAIGLHRVFNGISPGAMRDAFPFPFHIFVLAVSFK